jgi:hypothetical protein
VLEDEVADPPDDPAPLGWGHPAPRAVLEGPAGRAYRPVDVLGVSLSDPGQRVAGRWVGGVEGLTGRRGGPLSIDEQLARGGDEGFDGSFQGNGHVCVISLDVR